MQKKVTKKTKKKLKDGSIWGKKQCGRLKPSNYIKVNKERLSLDKKNKI